MTLIEEKKRAYKGLFVTDLDGTLLNSDKGFNEKDLDALKTLRLEGYASAIATGRSQYSFCTLLDTLGMRGEENQLAVDYVIFSTGAGVMEYPGEKIVEQQTLAEAEVVVVANYLQEQGLDYMIHKSMPDTHHFFYSSQTRDNPDFKRRLELYSDFATPISAAGLQDSGPATEVLCIVPGARAERLAAIIEHTFPACSVILATSPLDGESGWIEIFAKSVSKSSTVERLCNRIGVPRENTCAVGNDFNDEDLLRWSPNSYLVENGPPRLRSLFNVVASNNKHGVSEAIGCWLNSNGQ